MKPKEDEISLVVKGGHLSSNELRVVGEERSEQSADAVAETRGEVVQDDLRVMFCGLFPSSLTKQHKSSLLRTRLLESSKQKGHHIVFDGVTFP